jgi:hypothetical protein
VSTAREGGFVRRVRNARVASSEKLLLLHLDPFPRWITQKNIETASRKHFGKQWSGLTSAATEVLKERGDPRGNRVRWSKR